MEKKMKRRTDLNSDNESESSSELDYVIKNEKLY